MIQIFTDDENPIPSGTKAVVLFGATWHEACVEGGAMDQVLQALADASSSSSNNRIAFGRVDAEANPVLASTYEVTAVPTFVLLNEDGAVVEKVVGLEDAAKVTVAVQRLVNSSSGVGTTVSSPAATTTSTTEPEPLSQRLDRLIRSAPVMVFIKGTPTAPRCGFSRQIVEMLEEEQIAFGTFDILSDEEVRQGLKKHSDWPTYPQLYVAGELIGGLDIVKEMKAEGPSLREQLGIISETSTGATAPTSLNDRLKELIHRSPIMLFMKGLPSASKCGFSRTLVQILDDSGVAYDAFDILTDEEVRQGLKTYSDWPTYPQLYVAGELIGGLDIVREMQEEGSLQAALEAAAKQ